MGTTVSSLAIAAAPAEARAADRAAQCAGAEYRASRFDAMQAQFYCIRQVLIDVYLRRTSRNGIWYGYG